MAHQGFLPQVLDGDRGARGQATSQRQATPQPGTQFAVEGKTRGTKAGAQVQDFEGQGQTQAVVAQLAQTELEVVLKFPARAGRQGQFGWVAGQAALAGKGQCGFQIVQLKGCAGAGGGEPGQWGTGI